MELVLPKVNKVIQQSSPHKHTPINFVRCERSFKWVLRIDRRGVWCSICMKEGYWVGTDHLQYKFSYTWTFGSSWLIAVRPVEVLDNLNHFPRREANSRELKPSTE